MQMDFTKTSTPDYESILQRLSFLEKEIERIKAVNQPVPEKDRYMDIKNACAMLGVSKTGMYRLLERGELGYTIIGRQKRILVSELNKYSERNKVEPLGSIL